MTASGPQVIATGGGAFLSPRARSALGDRGFLCWLDATPTEIARRLRSAPDASDRPLLGEDLEGVCATGSPRTTERREQQRIAQLGRLRQVANVLGHG